MIAENRRDIEAFAVKFGGTAVLGYLCTLLILGKCLHFALQKRGLIFGCLVVPPVLLSGLLGLIIFSILYRVDDSLSDNFGGGLHIIKINLVNFIFAALALGLTCARSTSKHSSLRGIVTSLFHEGMPMIIYSQILIWGQTCCSLFVCGVGNMFGAGIPELFTAMVPLGLEAGRDIVAKAPKHSYWSDTVVEEAESVGLMATCVCAIILLSSRSFIASLNLFPSVYSYGSSGVGAPAPASAFVKNGNEINIAEAFNRNRKPSLTMTTPLNYYNNTDGSSTTAPNDNRGRSADSGYLQLDSASSGGALGGSDSSLKSDYLKGKQQDYASLGTHISFIALAVFLSFAVCMLMRVMELQLNIGDNMIFSGVRMFKLSMFFALLVMHFTLRNTNLRFNRVWFMRLCGFLLDVLMIAALSSSNPRPKSLDRNFIHYGLVMLFFFTCLIWNLFCFFVLAHRLFPNFWYERGLVLMCDCMGHSFSGLVVARTMDPLMETPVPAAYAYKLMLFFIPSSGGKNTIVVSMVEAHGTWVAMLVSFCVVASWILIFEKFFKHRFVTSFAESGGDSGNNSAASTPGRGRKDSAEGRSRGDSDDAGESDLEDSLLLSASQQANNPLLGASNSNSTASSGANRRPGVSPSVSTNDVEGGASIEMKSGAVSGASSAGASPTKTPLYPLPVTLSEESSILKPQHIHSIASWLSAERSVNAWELSYSLRRDGASLDTLMSLCASQDIRTSYSAASPASSSKYAGRTVSSADGSSALATNISHLIIIEDSWGYVFGGHIAHSMSYRPAYYGNGECFVFSLVPTMKVHRWTGKNDFFLLSNQQMFAMGGGGDGYAFQLDDELDTGISNRSDTFNNEVLSSSEYYKCLNIEVWTLTGVSFNV